MGDVALPPRVDSALGLEKIRRNGKNGLGMRGTHVRGRMDWLRIWNTRQTSPRAGDWNQKGEHAAERNTRQTSPWQRGLEPVIWNTRQTSPRNERSE